MGGLAIREAGNADDAVLGELLVDAFARQYARKLPGITMPTNRLAELRAVAERRASATVLAAEMDGRIVGTVTVIPPGSPVSEAWLPGAADIRLLAIDTSLQGQGLSGALLDAAEALARSWGVPAICLHVRREAEGIARLYRSRGYSRDETGDLNFLPQVFLHGYVLHL